jgi:hypothetical protein
MRKPTIYEVLRDRLGRNPTDTECVVEVRRILEEAYVERATHGKLKRQRRGRG